MDWLRAMENIHGRMALSIRVISNKDSEMDMEYGKQKKVLNDIQGIICLIRSMVMAFMNGQLAKFTREHICKIKGKDKVNFMLMDNSNIEVYGRMEINFKNNLNFNCFLLPK